MQNFDADGKNNITNVPSTQCETLFKHTRGQNVRFETKSHKSTKNSHLRRASWPVCPPLVAKVNDYVPLYFSLHHQSGVVTSLANLSPKVTRQQLVELIGRRRPFPLGVIYHKSRGTWITKAPRPAPVPVALWSERAPRNPKVAGSIPAAGIHYSSERDTVFWMSDGLVDKHSISQEVC